MSRTTILIRVPLDPAIYPPGDVEELDDAGLIELFREGGYDDIYGDRSTWTVERGERRATVPRAGTLSEALPLLVELRSFLPFGRASRLVDLVTCYVTDALGVPLPEKSAAPTTQMEKG